MQISKDALWKGIIESLIDEFIHYFFAPYVHLIDFERGFEFLDTELQKLVPDNPGSIRHADKLIKAWLKNGLEVWFLIHVEVQGYADPFFSRRMFECIYRIWEKYQLPVTGLAIYTDWDRSCHFSEFRETFMGSLLNYQFNTYVLRDHSPAKLALDSNPFAAVMEAAWQHLKKPKDEQDLRALKLDLIQRLKQRNIPKGKISLIIDFIKYIVPFTNSEIQAKFEQDLITLNQGDTPMGLQEAILDDVKKQGIQEGIEQGIEQGIEIGENIILLQSIPQLLLRGLGVETIAEIYQIETEKVLEIIQQAAQTQTEEE